VLVWVVVGSLLLAVVVWLLVRGDEGESGTPPAAQPASSNPVDRDAVALELLDRQSAALRQGRQGSYLSTWADDAAAQDRGRTVFGNLEDVTVGSVDLRYVGSNLGGLSSEQLANPGDSGWQADVEVTWRPLGGAAVRSTVTYAFVEGAGGAAVLDIRDSESGRAPVWALDHLEVRETPSTVAVATTPATAEELSIDLRNAAREVRAVLPGWRGTLTGYWPETVEQLEALSGSAPGGHGGIAAVTTTIDGSTRPAAPVAIMLNPDVFGSLAETGRHVVVTHEAAHVATDAVTVSMPLWVAEGFADYVGVGAVDVPLSVAAGQALHEVSKSGPPDHLPTDSEFSAARGDLGAAYEFAWLAARLIAEQHGEDALVRFYEAVVADPSDLDGAFTAELGTTEADFTRLWQRYLAGLNDAR
jgi:hypothetical protein